VDQVLENNRRDEMMNVKIKKLDENAVIPTYGSEYSAGCDLYACMKNSLTIKKGETFLVPTKLSIEIPVGYAGLIYARSGLASKKGLAPANKVGVIDADYRGEIMVALHNHSNSDQTIDKNERVAQMVITPFLKVIFEQAEQLTDTVRGTGGFGSTGKK
jgi:dUTP pyrophosphatase